MSKTFEVAERRCRVKKGWVDEGREGVVFCLVSKNLGQSWAVVVWDGEDEPDLFKARGLDIDEYILV